MADPQVDSWVWGKEKIVWGYDPSHQYTFKIIEPVRGRRGCMSLQFHERKSESWLVLRGQIWALAVVAGRVCTRIMRPGDFLNLPSHTIHRLMGLSDDAQVAEPSTPDVHSADKNAPKDVVRLHCLFGRPVTAPRSPQEQTVVQRCIEATEEAIRLNEQGRVPEEIDKNILLAQLGGAIG